MKFGKTNLSSLAAIVILSNLTLLRCGEPTNNSPEKKSVAPEPVAPEQTAPSSPVQPQTTEKPPVSTSAAETACVSIQQVTSHVAKSAGKSIVASAADRFCVHTVAATNENINGEPLTDGVTIAAGLKLAFSDVDSLDFGATYADAKQACESLKIDGGGWSLPARVAADSPDQAISIDAINAYIKHANRWPLSVRFYATPSAPVEGRAFVAVPRTGGVVELFDSAPQAVVCIKR